MIVSSGAVIVGVAAAGAVDAAAPRRRCCCCRGGGERRPRRLRVVGDRDCLGLARARLSPPSVSRSAALGHAGPSDPRAPQAASHRPVTTARRTSSAKRSKPASAPHLEAIREVVYGLTMIEVGRRRPHSRSSPPTVARSSWPITPHERRRLLLPARQHAAAPSRRRSSAPRSRAEELGAVVLGVSKDSIASHCKFRDKYSLAFPLLSDPTARSSRPTARGATRSCTARR